MPPMRAKNALPSIVESHTSNSSAAAVAAALMAGEDASEAAVAAATNSAFPSASASTSAHATPPESDSLAVSKQSSSRSQSPVSALSRPVSRAKTSTPAQRARSRRESEAPGMGGTAAAVPNQLTEEQLQELREIFSLVDVDRGGTISSEELGKLMATLGLKTTKSELQAMVSEIDKDGNGEIDFEEFVAVMSRKVSTSFTAEKLRWAFKQFEDDPREPGLISREMLIYALCHFGSEKLSPDDADDLVAQIIPTDSRNKFDFDDYLSVMFST